MSEAHGADITTTASDPCCICYDTDFGPSNPEMAPLPCACKGSMRMHTLCMVSVMLPGKETCATCKKPWEWDETKPSHTMMMFKTGRIGVETLRKDIAVWSTVPELAATAVGYDGMLLEFVADEIQTAELCLAAVKQAGAAIQFCKILNRDICLTAVRQNSYAIKYFLKGLLKAPTDCTAAQMYVEAIHCDPNVYYTYIVPHLSPKDPHPFLYDLTEAYISHNPQMILKMSAWPSSVAKIALEKDGSLIQYFQQDKLTADSRMTAVKSRGTALQFIPAKYHTAELCMTAVRRAGKALKWCGVRGEAIERAALLSDGDAIEYIASPSDEFVLLAARTANIETLVYYGRPQRRSRDVCLALVKLKAEYYHYISKEAQLDEEVCAAAVEGCAGMLQYVKTQTEAMCLSAVKRSPMMLQYCRTQTPEICLAAVSHRNDYMYAILKYVRVQTPEICLAAVRNAGMALEFIKEQTLEICEAAVKTSPYALKFAKFQTPTMCEDVVRRIPCCIGHVHDQTEELCLLAIEAGAGQDFWAKMSIRYILKDIRHQTPRICLAAVRVNGLAMEFVKDKTAEICDAAIQQNPDAARFLPGAGFFGGLRSRLARVVPWCGEA